MPALDVSLIADLGSSGLHPRDIAARTAEASELAAVSVSSIAIGYVIPYYNIQGKPLPFYRVKLLDHVPKYKQPKKSSAHIYFPPNFQQTLAKHIKTNPEKPYVIITEGEKKSAAACKMGFPAVGLGGVDSWRTRSFVLPINVELTT